MKKNDKKDAVTTFLKDIGYRFKDEVTGLYLSTTEKALVCTIVVLLLIIASLTVMGISSPLKETMIELNTFREDPAYRDILDELKQQEMEGVEEAEGAKATTNAYNTAMKGIMGEKFIPLQELEQQLASQESEPSEGIDKDSIIKTVKDKYKADKQIEKLLYGGDKQGNVKSNSYVTYWLEGRYFRGDFPNPIYTCDSKGKIVIDIEVDGYGVVKKASYNKSQSTSDNRCLIDNAVEYSYKAHFTSSENPTQKGSITYIYQ